MEEATVTSKGQVTIPKKIREELRLSTGSSLVFITTQANEVVLKPKESMLRGLERLRGKRVFSEKEFKHMISESKQEWRG